MNPPSTNKPAAAATRGMEAPARPIREHEENEQMGEDPLVSHPNDSSGSEKDLKETAELPACTDHQGNRL